MASPSANSYQEPTSLKRPRSSKLLGWIWPILWLGLLIGSGIVGGWALIWLMRIPPLPECATISPQSTDGDRIYCAKAQAQSSDPQALVGAIELVATWSQDHPRYEDALEPLRQASERLLSKAQQRMQAGDLEAAVDLASQIPLDTPLRPAAQAAIYRWRQEWAAAATVETEVQQAIQRQQWDQARQSLQRLKTLSSDYWLRDRYQYWVESIDLEQQAWAQLQEARSLANQGTPAELKQAIGLAHSIDLRSHAWTSAEVEINRWSESLLMHAFRRWELGDVEGAIAAVQAVPPNLNLAPDAQDLIQFGHAQRLASQAKQQAGFQPTYGQLFQLMEAIRAAEQIPTTSPFYDSARQQLQQWQQQLQDLGQLRAAQSVAALGQIGTYRVAIQQAHQVAPERPQRQQAQTLIAHWQKQIERIADRPILRQAEALAQAGTIAALKQAIDQAAQVPQGRALRIPAQTLIAQWRQDIQIIEDRPILNKAMQLADDNQLRQAIETARTIQPERALHERAQGLIQEWTTAIQIAEDGPILQKAKDLAYEGSLTAAINTAAQIGAGRALYDEAQRAIALWRAERDYIWSLREAAAEQSAAAAETTDETAPESSDSEP
ncbi:hypothetical protein XM38_046110 [Halomicronema hongdechloris C2206]|uniref:Chromosome segregation ATPase n=1 Tax=Halomicronema hongdechloris C2206 TaxID=1641165 RepID=A0A1Z3HTJ9_9CYAN|nr:hypothetical protein [Halomicronema hongdechloris]ASC73640.1 hypothetical protein XM38_046110 [Halomicronema hongdechloris C2206]